MRRSWGVTRFTRPILSASCAEIVFAVNINSQALALPTSQGRNQLPPQSGWRPIRAKLGPNVAVSDAIRMSQPNARLKPAPAHGPFTAATTGLGNDRSVRVT